MRVVRIFDDADAAGEQYAEQVSDVVNVTVTGAGALAIEREHGGQPGELRGVIIAAGAWQRAEDWNAHSDGFPEDAWEVEQDQPRPDPLRQRHDAEQLTPEQLAEQYGPPLAAALQIERDRARQIDMPTLPALPPIDRPAGLLPGHVQIPGESVGIVRDPLAQSAGLRLRHALTVFCICASLRCPADIYVGTGYGTAEPRQCDQLDQHTGTHTSAGRWSWGPHNHHASCPRHPGTYNAHVGEQCGRPLEIEGVPLVGTGCLLPWDHTGAHDYSTPDLDGRAAVAAAGLTVPAQRAGWGPGTSVAVAERRSAAAALRAAGLLGAADTLGTGWPVVTPAEPLPAPEPAAEPDVWAGLVEPGPLVDTALRGRPDVPLPSGWFDQPRPGWATCDALSLSGEPCDRPLGHDSGPHAHFAEDGGLIQW